MSAPQGRGPLVPQEAADLARRVADEHNVPADLVLAVMDVESDFRPRAGRFEEHWRWFVPFDTAGRRVSRHTERAWQATSWGLMQVMGSVARELGFAGDFLSDLVDPYVGAWYGARKLRELLDRYEGDELDTAAAYNAGSARRTPNGAYRNQTYVDRICAARVRARQTLEAFPPWHLVNGGD